MKKLLDLSEDCVKTLSKRAIDENTNFKNLAQDILEREANPNGFEKNQRAWDKKEQKQIATNVSRVVVSAEFEK